MAREEKQANIYAIPKNSFDTGYVFGGQFKTRNFVEGVVVTLPFLGIFLYGWAKLGLDFESTVAYCFSIANENIWLEADALGLGGVWLGIAPVEERMKAVEEVLQLPAEHHAFAIFALGYPAENKPQQDRYDVSRIHYVR